MNQITFDEFIRHGTSPTAGKYAELLFKNIMEYKSHQCINKHENGIDFKVEALGDVDVKVVRHFKHNKKARFRRYRNQLPGVIYAYVIFWNDCAELRIEKYDKPIVGYDCIIPKNLIDKTWIDFPKQNINIPNQSDIKLLKEIKSSLADWLLKSFGLKARIIMRGDRERNEKMIKRKWGADNFYEKHPNKFDLTVLLKVDKSEVYEIWSYPTKGIGEISWKEKNIGKSAKVIITFDPNIVDTKFVFKDLNEFKETFYDRFKPHLTK
jgi:hypothetical protein